MENDKSKLKELGVIEFIEEASILLNKTKTLKKIIIEGEKTSIVIEKQSDDNDSKSRI